MRFHGPSRQHGLFGDEFVCYLKSIDFLHNL